MVMEIVLSFVLTSLSISAIIIIMNKKQKNIFNKTVYKQSDMHKMLKIFFNKEINNKKRISQSEKRKNNKNTNVVILKNKAYWVANNIFYMGDVENGEVKQETAQPVNTSELSETDINKLLFILDTLKGGKANDSGSAGN